MIRTQIQLTEEQVRRLHEVAGRQGVSMAEVIRQCLDRTLVRETPRELYERASQWVGGLSGSAPADLASEHDRYLDGALDPAEEP